MDQHVAVPKPFVGPTLRVGVLLAVAIALPHGGLAVYDVERPTSVYVAYRRATQQVEVYDPSAREALRLVKTGFVRPVP